MAAHQLLGAGSCYLSGKRPHVCMLVRSWQCPTTGDRCSFYLYRGKLNTWHGYGSDQKWKRQADYEQETKESSMYNIRVNNGYRGYNEMYVAMLMYTLSAVYPTFDVFRMLKNFAFHYIEEKMHILRNIYITYAYMCIIYEEKNGISRILPSTCKESQNTLANNFVKYGTRSLKSFTDPITLVRHFLHGVYSGNCKADMYYISPNNAQNLKYNSQYAVNLPTLLYMYDNPHKLFKQVLAVTLTKIFVATKMQMFEFFAADGI